MEFNLSIVSFLQQYYVDFHSIICFFLLVVDLMVYNLNKYEIYVFKKTANKLEVVVYCTLSSIAFEFT